MDYLIEARLDYDRNTFFWVAATDRQRLEEHKEPLFSSLVDLSDWSLRHNPLIIVPLQEERTHGQVFRNLSLISPEKLPSIDGVLGCNAELVQLAAPKFYDLIYLFQSNKTKGAELLLKWSNENRLLIGGIFQ